MTLLFQTLLSGIFHTYLLTNRFILYNTVLTVVAGQNVNRLLLSHRYSNYSPSGRQMCAKQIWWTHCITGKRCDNVTGDVTLMLLIRRRGQKPYLKNIIIRCAKTVEASWLLHAAQCTLAVTGRQHWQGNRRKEVNNFTILFKGLIDWRVSRTSAQPFLTLPLFWNLLHAREQYEKQQPNFDDQTRYVQIFTRSTTNADATIYLR